MLTRARTHNMDINGHHERIAVKCRAGSKQVQPEGMAYIVAMVLLAALSTLAVAWAGLTDLEVRKSANCRSVMNGRLAAESGLSFMTSVLGWIRLPGSTTSETFPQRMAEALGAKLEGTPNIGGGQVTYDSSTVFVPSIVVNGETFSCQIASIEDTRCRLTVTGSAGEVTRAVFMDFILEPCRTEIFDYGLPSRGPISISGNARIVGVNDPSEASILSATTTGTDAIQLDGNAEISGDLNIAEDGLSVSISGTPTVAGSSDPSVIAEHTHHGVGQPDFPEVDVEPIAALATYTLQPDDPQTKTVLNNVRIPAGTNPTFGSDIQINGVVYVEAPNVVAFVGKCTLKGILVTQASGEPISACQVSFGGSVEASGVDALPDTPEFAAVKGHTGTFIAAPGFGVSFAGNFSAIGGSIAADQLTFTGTSEGAIGGSVIGLKDLPTTVCGNVDIFVDQQRADQNPAGFVPSLRFSPVPDSYAELQGG